MSISTTVANIKASNHKLMLKDLKSLEPVLGLQLGL